MTAAAIAFMPRDYSLTGPEGRKAIEAGPVLFLCSNQAGFMTGTCIAIDGGYSVS